jgi:hypothetical protein
MCVEPNLDCGGLLIRERVLYIPREDTRKAKRGEGREEERQERQER